MAHENTSLYISLEWWQKYQDLLKDAVAPLTADQLAFRLGSQRSAGEIVTHMVAVRAWYFQGVMGEGDAEIEALHGWEASDVPTRTTAELLTGIDQTWQLLSSCLARWTDADMRDTFFINWRDRHESRAWIVWHVLEHEIHHGGALSFTLGNFGLPGLDVY